MEAERNDQGALSMLTVINSPSRECGTPSRASPVGRQSKSASTRTGHRATGASRAGALSSASFQVRVLTCHGPYHDLLTPSPPAPGTSAIHRKPKRPRLSEDAGETPPSNPASAATSIAPHTSRNDAHVPNGTNAAAHSSPSAASALLDGLDPFELLTDEVKNSYLRCSYKWSFHHTPTLLRRIRDRTLEPWMVWAILALAIRYARLPGFARRRWAGCPPVRPRKPAS